MPAGQKTPGKRVDRLALHLQDFQGASRGDGLIFSIIYCGHEIATARFVPVWNGLPRLASYEHQGGYPHERIDHGQLEKLAAEEITRMLASDQDRFLAYAGGFVETPESGAGRRGAPRESEAMIAVKTRRALRETHRLSRDQKRIERSRARGLLNGDDFTPAGQKILDDVDEAKRRLLQHTSDAGSYEAADLWDAVGLGVDHIEAALYELDRDGVVALEHGDPEFRKLTGAKFLRVRRIAELSR